MRIPEVRTLVHESQLLRDNPRRDPHIRALPVYVPPGYDEHRKEGYPVVYLLAGWSGRGARYLNDEGVFVESLPVILDRMISKGEMRPALVVMPDCGTSLGASQYVDSVANGPYMKYLCDELVPFIDEKFHTVRDRSHRGVAGHSSGGFGALVTGMLRPDCFSALCSSAGDSWYEFSYVAPLMMALRTLEEVGGVQALLKKVRACPNPSGLLSRPEIETLLILCICSCYAPNLQVPELMGDLYFDLKTGELLPEVWNKILTWDPVHMTDRYLDNLKKLLWIHLEAGLDDEYGLQYGHRQLSKKFSENGISHVMDEYPGKHGGHHYRFGVRLQRMLEAMYAGTP